MLRSHRGTLPFSINQSFVYSNKGKFTILRCIKIPRSIVSVNFDSDQLQIVFVFGFNCADINGNTQATMFI